MHGPQLAVAIGELQLDVMEDRRRGAAAISALEAGTGP